MSAEIDPAKLKVVELRAELAARGLDTKGNKPVLVKRLKYALEKELEKELPDTSIADTSTEEFNTSQIEESETAKEDEPKDVPITEEQIEVKKSPEKVKEDKIKKPSVKDVDDKSKSEESSDTNIVKEVDKDTDEPAPKKPKIDSSPEKKMNDEDIKKDNNAAKTESTPVTKETTDENEEFGPADEEMPEAETEDEVKDNVEISSEACVKTAEEDAAETCVESKPAEEKESVKESPQRGDKRKRSPSPNRAQRRRSKSPIKEDEPIIDNSKVQLNWYDSDLHLQIDKESFLSGKPYHDGAFGYIWSGVRATHGADTGKVCYEVKITEELKWEDFIRQPDRGRKDRDRRDRGRERSERRDKSWDKRKSGDKPSDKKDSKHRDKSKEEKSEEKTESSEKPDETQVTKEEEETPTLAEDKETIKIEVKTEEKHEETIKIEVKTEVKQEEEKEEKAEDVETTKDVKMEPNDIHDSQKEEKSDETMEVDKTEGDDKTEKVEEVKDAETKEQKEKEEKSESKEKEVILPIPSHLIRIGWSSLNSGLQLGESKFSYGYESSGKFVNDKNFVEYGKPFSVGDVIGAYLEFTEETINIKYTINGEELPIAISVAKTDVPEENFSLFPHVLSRNYAFEVNLGGKEEPFFASPESLADYVYIDKFENKVLGPTRPETRGECEVIMMCGLPASGKTHWVKEHVANNPDKRYTVIGNTQLLEKMTVNGNPLKNNLKGRWNLVLEKLSKCLNKLVEVAALRRRNYVIDQTNVFLSAQRRKMRPFEGFKRRAVIVVCGDEEQARRRTLQEAQDGKDVPNIAVYEMKANMSLPKVGDWLEEVTYVELDEQQAKTMVQKYNKEGKDNGFGPITQRRNYRDDRSRWQQNRRNDYRGGYRDRNYPPNRFDRGSKSRGGWQSRSSSWGRNERRDNRGPSSSRPPRDWRNNNRGSSQRHQDRGREQSSRHGRDSYSRNRSQAGSRNQGNWQGGSGGSWGGYSGSQGNWQGQSGNWNPNYGSQGKWNYSGQSGGSGSGSYSQPNYNWNYQGQYMNWIGQDSGNWSK